MTGSPNLRTSSTTRRQPAGRGDNLPSCLPNHTTTVQPAAWQGDCTHEVAADYRSCSAAGRQRLHRLAQLQHCSETRRQAGGRDRTVVITCSHESLTDRHQLGTLEDLHHQAPAYDQASQLPVFRTTVQIYAVKVQPHSTASDWWWSARRSKQCEHLLCLQPAGKKAPMLRSVDSNFDSGPKSASTCCF